MTYGFLSSLLEPVSKLIYRFFPKIRITVVSKKLDPAKGLNTDIHPVNELIISIANKPYSPPQTIKDIQFEYLDESDETQSIYDTFSYSKIAPLLGKTLQPSEEANFSLSYLDAQERNVIDELKTITVILTHGRKYTLNAKTLSPVIEKLKKLPEPDPRNLDLNFNK